MDATLTSDPRLLGLALLVTRLVVGVLLAARGAQKLFGWFRGRGLKATAKSFARLGFRPGTAFAAAAGALEITGGLLIALGLLGPVGPALLLGAAVVALFTVHWGHGLLATSNGSELPVLYAAAAISVALAGPGPFALDVLLGIPTMSSLGFSWAVLNLGLLGGVASLIVRRCLVTLRRTEVRDSDDRRVRLELHRT